MLRLILLLAAILPNGENERTLTPADGVRAVVNTPGDFDPNRPTLLIFYTTKLAPGIDNALESFQVPGRGAYAWLPQLGRTATYWGPGVAVAVLAVLLAWWWTGRRAMLDKYGLKW